jgi:hypothetical protein
MVFNKQGFSIDIKTNENEIFIILKAAGKLTHEDYLILMPKIDAALEGLEHPKIKALLDTTNMEGWTLRALCDDCILGLRHGKKFSRVAIYGNKAWFKYAAKIGGFFISGEMKYFENYDEALEWVIASKN